MSQGTEKILEVDDLSVHFRTPDGIVRAVDGVSFDLKRGETLAVVGESGSGKSILSRSIMRLVPCPPGYYAGGTVRFEDREVLKLSNAEMRGLRGNKMSMIFQEPMTSLNPVLTVGYQITEVLRLHKKLSRKQAHEKAIEALRMVRIADAERRVNEYPHQMSGGMCQRVMIAMALACNPLLLIADEPTTALDVTIQAQILRLMKRIKEEVDTSIMLITHDLGVVAEFADRVLVMYAGRIVESGTVAQLFANPRHPYTKGLLASIPRLEQNRHRLDTIKGSVPNPKQLPRGCRFHPRCPYVMPRCLEQAPPDIPAGEDRIAACWLVEEDRMPQGRKEVPHADGV